MSVNSGGLCLIFCPDGPSVGESGLLDSPMINGLMLICVFKSSSRFFDDTGHCAVYRCLG